jgi:hypothetical protein
MAPVSGGGTSHAVVHGCGLRRPAIHWSMHLEYAAGVKPLSSSAPRLLGS